MKSVVTAALFAAMVTLFANVDVAQAGKGEKGLSTLNLSGTVTSVEKTKSDKEGNSKTYTVYVLKTADGQEIALPGGGGCKTEDGKAIDVKEFVGVKVNIVAKGHSKTKGDKTYTSLHRITSMERAESGSQTEFCQPWISSIIAELSRPADLEPASRSANFFASQTQQTTIGLRAPCLLAFLPSCFLPSCFLLTANCFLLIANR
jgi:hypothetical protein